MNQYNQSIELFQRLVSDKTLFQGYCEYIDSLLYSVELHEWSDYKNSPKESGIYVMRHDGEIVYIGETSNIHSRLFHHKNGNGSKLKNKIADCFKDVIPEEYLENCTLQYIPMLLGRAEVESFLIDKYNPIFNNYNIRKRYKK